MDGFAKSDSPRRKWTVESVGDSGWLYTDDDIDEWEDSLTEIRLAKLRRGPGHGYDDDYEDEEDWPDEDDWDDDDDLDEDDDEDYDWDDDEEEDSDEW